MSVRTTVVLSIPEITLVIYMLRKIHPWDKFITTLVTVFAFEDIGHDNTFRHMVPCTHVFRTAL